MIGTRPERLALHPAARRRTDSESLPTDSGTLRQRGTAGLFPIMRISRLIFVSLFVVAMGLPALTASSSADVAHLHVQLVFRKAELYPGSGDHGGLYFKLEPGWHV